MDLVLNGHLVGRASTIDGPMRVALRDHTERDIVRSVQLWSERKSVVTDMLNGNVKVVLQKPESLCFNPATGYLTSKATNSWVLSTLFGETTYYSTDGIKQVCLTPSTHGWHCFVAVLAQVYGQACWNSKRGNR